MKTFSTAINRLAQAAINSYFSWCQTDLSDLLGVWLGLSGKFTTRIKNVMVIVTKDR